MESVTPLLYPIGAVAMVAWGAIESRAARKRAHQAATAAQEAKDRLAPVANGFASEVKASLERIEGKVDRHIADHATSDLRGDR